MYLMRIHPDGQTFHFDHGKKGEALCLFVIHPAVSVEGRKEKLFCVAYSHIEQHT